jgi:hypothetical protein
VDSEAIRAREFVQAGDVGGAMRHLRVHATGIPIEQIAVVVGEASVQIGFDDLVEASRALVAAPRSPQALFDFGYTCVERGIPYLAIEPLREALRLVPDSMDALDELVAALAHDGRHQEAVTVLEDRDATLRSWPERYLLVDNAILMGDLAKAAANFARLDEPADVEWVPIRDGMGRMLKRAEAIGSVAPLDLQDLRGWHYVLTGGVLLTLSPYGFAEGMTGRWAYTSDAFSSCALGLRRLRLVLDAAGQAPETVSLLPDRSSQILGTAASQLFGLPAIPFSPDRTDTLVVAYDLCDTSGELAADLLARVPGQILFEHATCWTDPPAVSADVTMKLSQLNVAPWGPRMGPLADGTIGRLPPDDRSVADLAAEIVRAADHAEDDEGDGGTPPDPDSALAEFVRTATSRWLIGTRDHVQSSGPVRSSRFT